MAYDDAMCLAENDIKLQFKDEKKTRKQQDMDTNPYSRLNVEATVDQTAMYVEEGESKLRNGNLHDGIIYLRLAFHLTKIIQEVHLPLQEQSHLLSAQYQLFRVILMHKCRLEHANKAESSKFQLQKESIITRQIKLPPLPPPGKAETTEAEALQAVHKIQITKPRLPLEAVIGQELAKSTLENVLIAPYEQAKAFNCLIQKNGILLYGPPGNGKENFHNSKCSH